jgi:hypothetical protein
MVPGAESLSWLDDDSDSAAFRSYFPRGNNFETAADSQRPETIHPHRSPPRVYKQALHRYLRKILQQFSGFQRPSDLKQVSCAERSKIGFERDATSWPRVGLEGREDGTSKRAGGYDQTCGIVGTRSWYAETYGYVTGGYVVCGSHRPIPRYAIVKSN